MVHFSCFRTRSRGSECMPQRAIRAVFEVNAAQAERNIGTPPRSARGVDDGSCRLRPCSSLFLFLSLFPRFPLPLASPLAQYFSLCPSATSALQRVLVQVRRAPDILPSLHVFLIYTHDDGTESTGVNEKPQRQQPLISLHIPPTPGPSPTLRPRTLAIPKLRMLKVL